MGGEIFIITETKTNIEMFWEKKHKRKRPRLLRADGAFSIKNQACGRVELFRFFVCVEKLFQLVGNSNAVQRSTHSLKHVGLMPTVFFQVGGLAPPNQKCFDWHTIL